jgi:putative endonuclease
MLDFARQLSGRRAEIAARRYLERRGLAFENANFAVRFGEIDLIMLDRRQAPTTRVFVEVRYRRSIEVASPQETVSFAKQRRLTATAELYLKRVRSPGLACRFDVVALSGALSRPCIRWFQGAFDSQ